MNNGFLLVISIRIQVTSQSASRLAIGDAMKVFFTAMSTPPAPSLQSFRAIVSYQEYWGRMAESLMEDSVFDSVTHTMSGSCSCNRFENKACLWSDTRLLQLMFITFMVELVVFGRGLVASVTLSCCCVSQLSELVSVSTENLFDELIDESLSLKKQ